MPFWPSLEPWAKETPVHVAMRVARIHHGGGHSAGGEHANAAQTSKSLRSHIGMGVVRHFSIAVGQVCLELAQMRQLPRQALAQCRGQCLIG